MWIEKWINESLKKVKICKLGMYVSVVFFFVFFLLIGYAIGAIESSGLRTVMLQYGITLDICFEMPLLTAAIWCWMYVMNVVDVHLPAFWMAMSLSPAIFMVVPPPDRKEYDDTFLVVMPALCNPKAWIARCRALLIIFGRICCLVVLT